MVKIARAHADFAQFSEMSDKRETGWWMTQSDANQSPSTAKTVDTHTAVDKRRLTHDAAVDGFDKNNVLFVA